MKGYGFQIEMKFKTWKYGFKILEIPIIFTDRKEGASKMSGGIFGEAFKGVIKMKKAFYMSHIRETVIPKRTKKSNQNANLITKTRFRLIQYFYIISLLKWQLPHLTIYTKQFLINHERHRHQRCQSCK